MDSMTAENKAIENTGLANLTKMNGPGISDDIVQELSQEINNMLAFAIFNGIVINEEVVPLIQSSTINDLVKAHNLLCVNVSPATPKSIVYAKKIYEEGKDRVLFRKLPMLRNLIIITILFLLGFILTGMHPQVNKETLNLGIMENSGLSLLLNLGYLASISGLGVSFYLLRDISTSIKNGTLIPENSIYYLALIAMGIIGGLIFSEIITIVVDDPNIVFNKSVFALIGGFSAEAIFSILQSLIDRIKSIFMPVKN